MVLVLIVTERKLFHKGKNVTEQFYAYAEVLLYVRTHVIALSLAPLLPASVDIFVLSLAALLAFIHEVAVSFLRFLCFSLHAVSV